ncbi:hypothetical protein [Clostridium sp. DJ247]|uniref:hypothetical protein n=1 Tax=Clostridium sp. DJ247 TaxID=2726188 RepID=UPI00162AC714|nr:hypothetical protein [Clostridium sp. DJ247]MBC2580188.1 hypothetical protein [Clostridium sp. DJ247]
MKKILIIVLSVFLVGGVIKYSYTTNRCRNIDYAVERYFTTGFFNNYRLDNIGTMNLSFSNGIMAVVKVDGMTRKTPHKRVAYSVFLEKSNNGVWKVRKIYPAQVTLNNDNF